MRHSWLTKFGVLCLNQLVRVDELGAGLLLLSAKRSACVDGGNVGVRPERAYFAEELFFLPFFMACGGVVYCVRVNPSPSWRPAPSSMYFSSVDPRPAFAQKGKLPCV